MIQVYGVRAERMLTESERLAAIEYLTPERKAKALRFRRLNDQEKGILTGLLEDYVIRRALAFPVTETNGERTRPYVIERGSEGKPYIVGHPEIFYNLSHSGDLIVCGIGNEPLGIDVEREDRYSRRIVERFFQPEEVEDINGGEGVTEAGDKKAEDLSEKMSEAEYDKRQKTVFAKYWVMKESFMKLSGAGFAVPVQSFHCNRETGEIRMTERVPQEWRQVLEEAGMKDGGVPICHFLETAAEYQCAVCTLSANSRIIPLPIMTVEELLAEMGIRYE